MASCGGTQFDGHTFRSGDIRFRIAHVPPTFRQIEIADTALAFRDDENAATVAINGRCGKDAADVPLQALTQHLFLQFTERELVDESLFPLDRREALRTKMSAKLDGVRKHFLTVVLKKDHCVYDFLYIADRPISQPSERRFDGFVRGFSTLE